MLWADAKQRKITPAAETKRRYKENAKQSVSTERSVSVFYALNFVSFCVLLTLTAWAFWTLSINSELHNIYMSYTPIPT